MPHTSNVIIIDPSGATMTVDLFDQYGTSTTTYTTASGSTAHTLPKVISSVTEFHLTTDATKVSVSAKINGVEIAGPHNDRVDVYPSGGVPVTVTPTVQGSEAAALAEAAALPAPSTGDAGKVPTVNEAEDGYELSVPSGGGSSTLVQIPISTDEGDWDNSDASWVFNGDGTITSLTAGSTGALLLPLPTARAWLFALDLSVPVVLAPDGAVARVFVTDTGDSPPQTGFEVDRADPDYTLYVSDIWNGTANSGALVVPTGSHVIKVKSGPLGTAGYIDGVAHVAHITQPDTTDFTTTGATLEITNVNLAAGVIIDLANIVMLVAG